MIKKIKNLYYKKSVDWRLMFATGGIGAADGLSGAPGVDLTIQSVFGIITGLACWFSRFALIAVVVAILYYGIRILISQGNETKFKDARKGLGYALLGTLVIMATYTIIATVANSLGADYNLFIPLDCSVAL